MSPTADSAPAPAPRPWIVLLVDDEEDILAATQELIEDNIRGVRVITADSGRTALGILERERIDLIVSDFSMPGMDGIEFLFQARRTHPNVPRVMFTAFNNEDLARRAIVDAMVSSFVSKSVEPERLLQQLATLLKYEPPSGVTSAPSGHLGRVAPEIRSDERVAAP